jgi:hypothetical protein
VVRFLVVLLAGTLLAAWGGRDTADRGTEPPSTNVATTSGEDELLYGCIEPGTAKPLTLESAGAKLDAAVCGNGSVGIVLAHESDGSLCKTTSAVRKTPVARSRPRGPAPPWGS